MRIGPPVKFTRPLLITKLKATGVHLSLSIAVFLYLTYRIYYHWYPQPYFEVDGGWQGFHLIAAVDLVLGPLITVLIFDLSKSTRAIIFDLIIIAVVQFGALAYGVYTTYIQRPVAIVLIDDFVISAIRGQYKDSIDSVDELRQYSDEWPPIIFADMPTTQSGIDEVQRIKLEGKILEHAQINLYAPREKFVDALKQRQVRFSDRLDFHKARERYEAYLQRSGKSADEILIAPFDARYGRVWLIFDLDGKLIDYFF